MAAQFLLALAPVLFKAHPAAERHSTRRGGRGRCRVCASFFPVGFHFAIAAVLCCLIAGNLAAAALGAVVFGNPLTFPLLWGASWETGKLMLHDSLPSHGPPEHLSEMLHNLSFSQLWGPVLKPMLVGAVPLGLIFGVLFYGITRWGMTAFREQRRKRLSEKASRLLQQEDNAILPTLPKPPERL